LTPPSTCGLFKIEVVENPAEFAKTKVKEALNTNLVDG
jgi:hypothetical protein